MRKMTHTYSRKKANLPKVFKFVLMNLETASKSFLILLGSSMTPSSSMWEADFTSVTSDLGSMFSSLWYSIAVSKTTSTKGKIWQKISQMSIILMSEVGGRLSILLMKMVVITSMVVKFTLKAASKKKGSKKVVAKVIAVRRRVGK